MGSVTKILPSLTDKKKQLEVFAASANAKGLCALMVFGNKKISDILKVENGHETESILFPICRKGDVKAFKLILYLMTEQKLSIIDELFKDDVEGINSIEYAI